MSASPTHPERDRALILVVEDDRSLRDGLAMNLRLHGYEVLAAADGEAGMRLAFEAHPDLIVLDIMLPGWTGLEILEELRRRRQDVPVLILSARSKIPDKIKGLNLGADDYVTKPFDLPELLARIAARLRGRQREEQSAPPLVFGAITIHPSARRVERHGKTVALSAREFDLLCLLASSPGRVFTREVILERVWGWDYDGTARTVDNFVANLRKKLRLGRNAPPCLRTIPGVGYTLAEE